MIDAEKAEKLKAVAYFFAVSYKEKGWDYIQELEHRLPQEEWQFLCDEFAQSLAEIY